MTKRFTATEKWDDPWFCSLSPEYKLFWIYLCDNCNSAGIWNVNWPLVKFHIWQVEFDLKSFGGRIIKLSEEKWFIKGFVLFQQKISSLKALNQDNNAHKSIIQILKKEGIIDVNCCEITIEGVSSPLLGASEGLGSPPGIVKVKVNKRTTYNIDTKFIPPIFGDVQAFCSAHKISIDIARFIDFYQSKGWMVGKTKMKDWKASVRNWARSGNDKVKFVDGKPLNPKKPIEELPTRRENPDPNIQDEVSKLIKQTLKGLDQ